MKQLVLPEEKLNALAQEISDKLLQSHYFNQGIIRGEDLKDFAEHSQINKFLLFQVYQVWNIQISKLKHPYFDFDQAQIQENLQLLRNLLSQNIRINQQDFKPMLKRAVYNNLKLLVDPKESFESFFFANRDKTPLELYERYTPFFSDFDFIVNSILHYHKKHHMEMVEKDIFFLKMEKIIDIFNKKSGKDFEAYRKGIIERLTERDLEELIQEAKEEEQARNAQQAEEARRKEEEKARLEAEERIKQEADEKKKEEELERIAAEKARLEAEALRKQEEEAIKRQSFFDTLSETDNFFDLEELDEEDSISLDEDGGEEAPLESTESDAPDESSEASEVVGEVEESDEEDEGEQAPSEAEIALQDEARRRQEENLRQAAEAAKRIKEMADRRAAEEARQKEEEAAKKEAEEKAREEKEAAEKQAAEEARLKQEAEEAAKKKAEAEELARKEEEENRKREEDAKKAVEEAQEEAEKTIADKFAGNQEQSILDRFRKKEENVQVEDPSRPKTVAERLAEAQGNGEQTETTTSFLDRFLNSKKEAKAEAPSTTAKEPEEKKVETPATPAPKAKEVSEEAPAPKTLAEQLEQDKPQTLADRFKQTDSSKPKLHQRLNGDNKIKLNEIPVHKQYQYVQKVFDGNNVRFRIIVDKVNNAKTKDEVEEILQKFVLSKDEIDNGDSVVQEFIELLRNRF